MIISLRFSPNGNMVLLEVHVDFVRLDCFQPRQVDVVFLIIIINNTEGFIWVLEILESPGILLSHFPGLESPGQMLLVLESPGNLLN